MKSSHICVGRSEAAITVLYFCIHLVNLQPFQFRDTPAKSFRWCVLVFAVRRILLIKKRNQWNVRRRNNLLDYVYVTIVDTAHCPLTSREAITSSCRLEPCTSWAARGKPRHILSASSSGSLVPHTSTRT